MYTKICLVSASAVLIILFIYFRGRSNRRYAVQLVIFKLGLLKSPHERALKIFWEAYDLMKKHNIEYSDLGYGSLSKLFDLPIHSFEEYIARLEEDVRIQTARHRKAISDFFRPSDSTTASVIVITTIGNNINSLSEKLADLKDELVTFRQKVYEILNNK